MFVVHILIFAALIWLPMLAMSFTGGRPEGFMWLAFPVLGALPVAISALLVFAPLTQRPSDRRRVSRREGFVLAGGAFLIAALTFLIWRLSGVVATAWPFLLLSPLGAMWGVIWRITEHLTPSRPSAA